MNNTKLLKKFNPAPLFIALFIFLRAFVLSDIRLMGFKDFYPLAFSFSTEGIVLICLYIAFAVLSALLFSKLEKKFGKVGILISAVLVAEPLLFSKQENCINVFVWCLALLFILNALRDKPIIPNEITLVVFILASTILIENALYLFVFPALVFYFIPEIDKSLKNIKKLVMMLVSAASIFAGIMLNDYLIKTYPVFESFIKKYSFFKHIYFKHIDYENALLFVFTIPVLVLGICFFREMFKNKVTVSNKVNSNKKSAEVIESFNPVFAVGAIAISYVLSIGGFIQAGSAAFYTINWIIPLAMISFLNAKNSSAEKSMEKLGIMVEKHLLLFIVVLIVLFSFASRVFFVDVDSLAKYIISMG